MRFSIKKGTTNISISYINGDYSNTLYCSDVVFIKGETNTLSMNFQNIIKSRIKTNSNDDLDDLIKNINGLERIQIFDSTVTKSLLKKLKQNEEITLCLIIDKAYNLHSKIVFKSVDEFELLIRKHSVNPVLFF